MRDAKLGVRSLITALVLLAIASFNARGDESADFLGHLHDFRVKNYVALDAYYRFSASGDTETLNEIVGAVNKANSTMGALTDSTAGVLSSAQVEGLNVEFDKFKELMRQNINDVKQTGYPDLRLMSEMAEQAAVMNDNASSLYRTALESTKITPDKRLEAARSAAVTLAQMMAKYSVRSNSSVTQTFQGTATDEPLDVKAKALDSLLAEIRKGKSTGELKALLEDISSKWEFIRTSYINYNENNVSFVIDRYSRGILEGLTATISLLQSQA